MVFMLTFMSLLLARLSCIVLRVSDSFQQLERTFPATESGRKDARAFRSQWMRENAWSVAERQKQRGVSSASSNERTQAHLFLLT
jgi:hypothetical protein